MLSKTQRFFSQRWAFFLAFLRFFWKLSFFPNLNSEYAAFDLFVFNIVIVLYFKFYNLLCTSCLANEVRAWLLYYSLPCLSGILPQPFLDHFTHLVEAIHLFLGTVISPNVISKGQECLTYFYKEFGVLYGIFFSQIVFIQNVICLVLRNMQLYL